MDEAKVTETLERIADFIRNPSIAQSLLVVIFLFAFVLYFIPSIIALSRHTYNAGNIVLLNIFLGWTVIMWFVCLIFACDSKTTATKKRGSKSTGFYPYRTIPLFTQPEAVLFEALKANIENTDYVLLAKVRWGDLLKVADHIPDNIKTALEWKIRQKHVDFLICNKSLTPILVIELDDSSHSREDRRERDEFLDGAFGEAGIRVLHIIPSEMKAASEKDVSENEYVLECLSWALPAFKRIRDGKGANHQELCTLEK